MPASSGRGGTGPPRPGRAAGAVVVVVVVFLTSSSEDSSGDELRGRRTGAGSTALPLATLPVVTGSDGIFCGSRPPDGLSPDAEGLATLLPDSSSEASSSAACGRARARVLAPPRLGKSSSSSSLLPRDTSSRPRRCSYRRRSRSPPPRADSPSSLSESSRCQGRNTSPAGCFARIL